MYIFLLKDVMFVPNTITYCDIHTTLNQ